MNASDAFAVARKPDRLTLKQLNSHLLLVNKLARVKRIKAHISAYPGKSYCYPEDRKS